MDHNGPEVAIAIGLLGLASPRPAPDASGSTT